MSLRILFAPFGSEGDLNPLLWLAEGLAARGHEPVFLLSPHYARHAESRGFAWIPVGTEEEFAEFASNPDLWHAYRGPSLVMQGMLASLPHYKAAFRSAGSNFDLVVLSSFALAASSLAEAAKLPRLALHFQPVCLRSEFECPLFLPELFWLKSSPRWFKRLFYACVDYTFWRKIGPSLNSLRAESGLPPLTQFYEDAVNGAEHIAGLFPDWFAAPQPDWPRHFRQLGFPVSREAPRPLPPDLVRFLEAGEPPIVWTHGSANFFVHDFQECALRVSQELGLRCLLVSLQPPARPLPDSAFHCPHVRFDDLFPHCRAAVHHGGIGTTAKCIAAGIPQLIIPRSHDQPDNADRMTRLGLGGTISYRQIKSPEVARALQKILKSPSVAERCREYQKRMATADPLTPLCDWAEEAACRKS
jgi:rhamnosyltransferase subunit B